MNRELSTPAGGEVASGLPGGAEWLASPHGAEARRFLHETDARTLADQIALTSIPAPPFGEEARGEAMAARMRECGLDGVATDAVGNVTGWWPRAPVGPIRPLVVAAHLDTVFPAGTPVDVHVEGDLLRAPGIGDDGRGLAVLLALARCCSTLRLGLERPLLFAATVGEEGVGDLRGVRHLFSEEGAAKDAVGFVSVDGAGSARIVTHGLGSLRFRVRAKGPGGHSWVDWGTTNPIHLIAAIVAEASGIDLPDGVTLSTGRIHGGKSINAIPEDAWAEIEIRGRDAASMAAVHRELERVIETVRARVDERRTLGPPARLEVETIGHRPAGTTSPDESLVRAAIAATEAIGERPELAISSTDANLPMSLGIPSITIGGGGVAGQAHTLDEWYRNEKGPDGAVRALLTLVLADAATASSIAAD